MTEMLKIALEFLDRFPALTWRIGISCLGLGAAVYGAIWTGFVRRGAFNGYAEDAAAVSIAVGVGCFLIGARFLRSPILQ